MYIAVIHCLQLVSWSSSLSYFFTADSVCIKTTHVAEDEHQYKNTSQTPPTERVVGQKVELSTGQKYKLQRKTNTTYIVFEFFAPGDKIINLALFIRQECKRMRRKQRLKHSSLSNTHNINGYNIDIVGAVSNKFYGRNGLLRLYQM